MSQTPSPALPLASDAELAYQRRLFFFLGAAGFFEGYDTLALTQALPHIRVDMGLTTEGEGLLVGLINTGMILAYLLVHNADRWGRRRVLTITVIGFGVAMLLSGLATNVWTFGAFQMVSRLFLATEWAVATVYAAEEFPAHRRGTVIGIIHGLNGLGAVTCAGLTPLLLKSPFGWRMVYFVGALPIFLIAMTRRSLRETRRFTEQVKTRDLPFTRVLQKPYRSNMLKLSLLWALTYACTASAMTFWKEFAVSERAMSDADVGRNISIAAVLAMPLAFTAGKIIDRFGRRVGAVLIYGSTVLGIIGCYTLSSTWAIVGALVAGIAGITAVGVVVSAYTAELFPTDMRGAAFGWSNHLLGRTAFVLSPITVGFWASRIGWGHAVASTTLFPAIALVLILWLMPETRGRELEETSAAKSQG